MIKNVMKTGSGYQNIRGFVICFLKIVILWICNINEYILYMIKNIMKTRSGLYQNIRLLITLFSKNCVILTI